MPPLPCLDNLSLRDGWVCTAPTGANMSADQELNQSVCFLCGGPMACALEVGIGGTGFDDAATGNSWKMLEGQFMDRRIVRYVAQANEEVQVPDDVPPEERDAWLVAKRQRNEENLRRWSWDTAVLADGHRYHRRCLVDFYRQEEQAVDQERRTLRGKRAQTPPEEYVPKRPLDRFARCPKSVAKWESVVKQNATGYSVEVSPIRKFDPPPSAADVKDIVEDMEYDPKLGKGVSLRELDATEDELLRFGYAKARVAGYLNPSAPAADPAAAAMRKHVLGQRDEALRKARANRDEAVRMRDEAFEKLAREKREADNALMRLNSQKDYQESLNNVLKDQAEKSEAAHNAELNRLLLFIKETEDAKAEGESKAQELQRLRDAERSIDDAAMRDQEKQEELDRLEAERADRRTEANVRIREELAKKARLEEAIKATEQRLAAVRVRKKSAQAKAQSLQREVDGARVHQQELKEAQKRAWAAEKDAAAALLQNAAPALSTPDRLLPTLAPPAPPPPEKKKESKAQRMRRQRLEEEQKEKREKAEAEAKAKAEAQRQEAERIVSRIAALKTAMRDFMMANAIYAKEGEWWREQAPEWMHVMTNRLARLQTVAAAIETKATQIMDEQTDDIADRDLRTEEWRRILHAAATTQYVFLDGKMQMLTQKAELLTGADWKRQKSAIEEAVKTRRELDATLRKHKEIDKLQRYLKKHALENGVNLEEATNRATEECAEELREPTEEEVNATIRDKSKAPVDPLAALIETQGETERKENVMGIGFVKTAVEVYVVELESMNANLFMNSTDPTTRGLDTQTETERKLAGLCDVLITQLKAAHEVLTAMQKAVFAEILRDPAAWSEVDIAYEEQIVAEYEKHEAYFASDAFAKEASALAEPMLAVKRSLVGISVLFDLSNAVEDEKDALAKARLAAWARLALHISVGPLQYLETRVLTPMAIKKTIFTLAVHERELLWSDYEIWSNAVVEAEVAVRKAHADAFRRNVDALKKKFAAAEVNHQALWGFVRELRTDAYAHEATAIEWSKELEALLLLHVPGQGMKNLLKDDEVMMKMPQIEVLMAFVHLRNELDMFDTVDMLQFLEEAERTCNIIATQSDTGWRMMGIDKALSERNWGLGRVLALFRYVLGETLWTRCFGHLSYKDTAKVLHRMLGYTSSPPSGMVAELKTCLRDPRVKVAIDMLMAHTEAVASTARDSMNPNHVFRDAGAVREQLIKRYPQDGTFNTMRDPAIAELEKIVKDVMTGKLVDETVKMSKALEAAQAEYNICLVAFKRQEEEVQELKKGTGLGNDEVISLGPESGRHVAFKGYLEQLRAAVWMDLRWATPEEMKAEWRLAGAIPKTAMNPSRRKTYDDMFKAHKDCSAAIKELMGLYLQMTGETPSRNRRWDQPENKYVASLLSMSWLEEKKLADKDFKESIPDFNAMSRNEFIEDLVRQHRARGSDADGFEVFQHFLQATSASFAVGARQYLATCRRHTLLLYDTYGQIVRARQGNANLVSTVLKHITVVVDEMWKEIHAIQLAYEIFFPFTLIGDVIQDHLPHLMKNKPALVVPDADYKKYVEATNDPAFAETRELIRNTIKVLRGTDQSDSEESADGSNASGSSQEF